MKINNLTKNFYFSLITVIVIFILDRITKLYVIYKSENLLSTELFISKYLNINLIWNNGIAFGLFSLDQGNLYNILTIIILIIIIIIFKMSINSEGIKNYALLIILGGALGNFYDRIYYKQVPDFIDFHVGNFHWFIFNIADVFISIGVISLIILELKNDKIN